MKTRLTLTLAALAGAAQPAMAHPLSGPHIHGESAIPLMLGLVAIALALVVALRGRD